MKYDEFERIFNKSIFEKSKPDLIKKIATYPERYVGLFRPTKPKSKIIQNLLQSHEIRFGDAFEILIREYLKESGFSVLDNKFSASDGERLEVDQMFTDRNAVFFVEQKIRDDHDSTKKRGQIENFERKTAAICQKYAGSDIRGFFYFIDASFMKNKRFYTPEIEQLSRDYGVPLHLSYGAEFFSHIGKPDVWEEILSHLVEWKSTIPELPEINFDKDPQASLDELKSLQPVEYRKLLDNPDLDDLLFVLFPECKTPALLADHFKERHESGNGAIYGKLRDLCANTIHRLKSRAA